MPVIENLKNLIRSNRDPRQTSPTTATGASPTNANSDSSHRKSKSMGSKGDIPAMPAAGPAAVAQGAAPSAAQRADLAAYQPEPGTKSEAQHFVAANPALQPPMDDSAAPIPSPSLAQAQAAGTGGALATHGEAAAAMIEKARLERGKMPVYQGLPEHFVLLEKMGDGAFSNVYKALDKRTGQKVAIKCVRKYELNRTQGGKQLNADLKKKPRATERANILKEVSIMRTLNHPSIIKLLSFTESREHYFLVLELMEGGELFHQIVKLTYFSEELARHVIVQVARAVRYLHEEKGVVHRDIKPENLLFEAIPIVPSKNPKARPYDEEKEDEGEFIPSVGGGGIGQVKIADFGLSKIVWAEDTATPCGTVGYTAPEIVKDERYSKSVDMWALGCVLYTLLCGFPPFFDESIQVLTEKVARGYYTFLSPWWDDISASSKDLITHLLCVDPEKRFTIDQFLAHPWCHEKPAGPILTKADMATLAPHVQKARKMNYAPLDSPLLQSRAMGGQPAMRTPGLHQLREAFDVTYAVHRMEEEGARRARHGGPQNPAVLHGLNEEDEGEEDVEIEESRRKYGQEVSQAIEDTRRRVVAAAAASGGQGQDQSNAQYQGWGGANRQEAEAVLYGGRAGPRDRGKNKAAFELNMTGATLLGRRKDPLSAIPPHLQTSGQMGGF